MARAGSAPVASAMVLGSTVSVQFGATLADRLFARVGPAGAVTLRLVFAAAVLAAVTRPRLRGRRRGDLLLAAAFGLALGGMNLCFYQAIERIPLGAAVTLEFVGPLAVSVIGSRRPVDLLLAALAAGGVALLAGGGLADVSVAGVVFALAAGTLWAGYIVLSARTGRRFPGQSGLGLAMVVGALAVLPFGLASAGGELVGGRALLFGAGVALLSSVLPYSLELEALRRIEPHVFGVLMSLEPAVAALAGLLVLGQRLSATQVVAMALVVVAGVGASRPRRGEPRAVRGETRPGPGRDAAAEAATTPVLTPTAGRSRPRSPGSPPPPRRGRRRSS